MGMNLSVEQWIGLIGLLITLGGLIYKWNQGRPRRRVKVSLAEPIGPGTYSRFIAVSFINERGPVVVIEEVGFECADGSKFIKHGYTPPYDDLVPTEVLSSHSARYCFELEELRRAVKAKQAIPVRAYCRDATGQYYKSPKLSRAIWSP